jgi:hypothetical protein
MASPLNQSKAGKRLTSYIKSALTDNLCLYYKEIYEGIELKKFSSDSCETLLQSEFCKYSLHVYVTEVGRLG